MKNKMLQLIIILSILLVVAMPLISSESIPLTKKEKAKFGIDEFGLVSYGHFWSEYKYNKNTEDKFIEFDTEITIYNTYAEPIDLDIKAIQYSEERVHEKIRENYTYYNLPNLGWIETPDTISVQSNHKYKINVHSKIPVDEAFEKSNGGGYIYLITPITQNAQLNALPAYKIFVTLLDEEPVSQPVPEVSSSIIFLLSLGLSILLFLLIKKINTIRRVKPNEK